MRPRPIPPINPLVTVATIVEIYAQEEFQGIVLLDNANLIKTLPGGNIEYGETIEHAVQREIQEKTLLTLSELRQFHVYSDPSRNARRHIIEIIHLAKAFSLPHAGDPAAQPFVVALDEIPWDQIDLDHKQILQDYVAYKQGHAHRAMILP